MIKINLAKTQVYGGEGTQVAFAADLAAGRASGSPHPALKVLIILIFPIALYVYERFDLEAKRKVLIQISAQAQEIEKEVSEFGSLRTAVENLVKEKEKLTQQLSVIEQISQKRAFKLQAIRKVQDNLPDDLWINELVVDQDTVIFKGFSRSASSIQDMVGSLSKEEVVLSAKNRELTRVRKGMEEVNAFDVELRVRN